MIVLWKDEFLLQLCPDYLFIHPGNPCMHANLKKQKKPQKNPQIDR